MAQSQKFLVHLDLNGNDLRNIVLGTIAGTAPGAVWFDSVAGAVKFVDGDSVVQTIPATSAIEAELADLSTLITTEVSRLEDLISDETAARSAAVAALDSRVTTLETDLAAETAARTSADSALQGAVDAIELDVAGLTSDLSDETAARVAGDAALQTAVDAVVADLATEVADRVAGDAAIQAEVDTLEVDLAAETAARVAADSALDTRVSAVEADLAGLNADFATDAELAAAVAAEAALREAADDALQTAIDGVASDLSTEVARATAAETALEGDIDVVAGDLATEAARATAAEAALQSDIDGVDAALAAEVTRATAAEGALDTRVTDIEGTLPTLATVVGLDAAIAAEVTRSNSYADAAALAAENNAKAHAEALAQGLNVKEAARAFVFLMAEIPAGPGGFPPGFPAGELPLAGDTTVEGVLLAAGDRIVVESYNTAIASGIYVVGETETVLAADWANDTNTTGSYVLVIEGTGSAGTSWVFNQNDDNDFSAPGTSWKQFAGNFNYDGYEGVGVVGRTIVVDPVLLSATHGIARKVAATIGDGSTTSFTITTDLDEDCVVTVREVATGQHVQAGITSTNGSVTVEFLSAPAADAYRVTVIGMTYASPEEESV